MGQLRVTLGMSSQRQVPVPLPGMQAGSLPRWLHLLTELIKLLLLQLRHDSVESIDLNRETDTLAMEAAVAMLELYQEGPGGQGLRREHNEAGAWSLWMVPDSYEGTA